MKILLLFLILFLISCTDTPSGSDQKSFDVLVDASFFQKHFKTSKVKIVFRDDNENALNFLEIDGDSFDLNQLNVDDGVEPYHPQFSPDGSKIVFSTGAEGVMTPSALYVIDISTPEYKTYKLEGINAAIPRWRGPSLRRIRLCIPRMFLANRKK